jgi:DNA-3-methyladenine glycosylase
MKLERSFYKRDARTVARELLGKYLVYAPPGRRLAGKIVETEAYLGERDMASHAFHGRTRRTEVMFGEGGHLYVYFIYGLFWLANVVTGEEGTAGAVLLRALEPAEGIEEMAANRGGKDGRLLTSGPARLTCALGIDGALNGADLCGDLVWIEDSGERIAPSQIVATKRVGVAYAKAWKDRRLRFHLAGNKFVSIP